MAREHALTEERDYTLNPNLNPSSASPEAGVLEMLGMLAGRIASVKGRGWHEAMDVTLDEVAAKLSGIESGATADMTAAEIRAALLTADGAGSNLDADFLDGLNSTDFVRKAGDTGVVPFEVNADPDNGNKVARRSWVENLFAAKDHKDNVRAATTANIALTGTQTVDGVALAAGNRVLVKNQTAASENGIYVVAASAWTRAGDANASNEVTSGAFVYVSEGSQMGTSWWITTPDPITLGTTPVTWSQFGGPGAITAGSGLTRDGNQISILPRGITAAMVALDTLTAAEVAAANKDGAAATPSMRTLGTGAQQAMPGNALRGHQVMDEGAAVTQRGVINYVGQGVAVADDAVNGRTLVTITGSSSPAASDTAPGIAELATNDEVHAGTDAGRITTPAGYNFAFQNRLERVFGARAYSTDMAQVQEQGVFRITSEPKIVVPALGNPPPGTKWVIDVIGMIRMLPPAGASTNLLQVMINGAGASGIAGGTVWAGGQSMCPVFAYGINPPTLTSSFTVEFSMWSSVAATWQVRAGDNPVVRAYLVKA